MPVKFWFLCLGIALITFLAFSPCLTFKFVEWDDDISIYYNQVVTKPINISSLKTMFAIDGRLVLKYIPLYWLSLSLTHSLFGLNPLGYHLGNLLLHMASAVLLFYLLILIAQKGFEADFDQACWPAFFASLLWAVHPLRSSVIGLSANRSYCQAIFFVIISFISYVHFMYHRKTSNCCFSSLSYWSAAFFLALSLLSFPIALTFGITYLLFDIFYFKILNLSFKSIVVEKIPLAMITGFILSLNLLLRASPQGIRGGHQYSHIDFGQWMKAFYMWAFYLWKPWLPQDLKLVNPVLMYDSPVSWPFILSALVVIGITSLAYLYWKKHRGFLVLWIFHIVILVPVLGLSESSHAPSERYSYLQGILYSFIFFFLCSKLQHSASKIKLFKLWPFLMGCLIVLLAYMNFTHIYIWEDSKTLFTHIIENLKGHHYSHDILWRLGKVYYEEGQNQKALNYLNQSIAINPENPNALLYRGRTYYAMKRYPEAKKDLIKTLKFFPKQYYLNVLLGDLAIKQNKPKEAVYYYYRLVLNGIRSDRLFIKLAQAYEMNKEPQNALKSLELAIQVNPKNSKARERKKHLEEFLKK